MDHTGSGNDDAASSTSFLMSKPKRAAAAGDKVYTPAAAAEKEQQALQLEEGGGDDGMAWKKLDKLSDWASPGTRVRHSKSGCVGVVVGVNVAWTSVLFDTDPGKAMSGSGMQRSCRVSGIYREGKLSSGTRDKMIVTRTNASVLRMFPHTCDAGTQGNVYPSAICFFCNIF
jgi:hypothetical protein